MRLGTELFYTQNHKETFKFDVYFNIGLYIKYNIQDIRNRNISVALAFDFIEGLRVPTYSKRNFEEGRNL